MLESRVLIYDGDCQFCRLCMDYAIRKLRNLPEYVAFQRINPSDFGLTLDQVKSQIWLVGPKETPLAALGGHLAVGELLKNQPGKLLKFAGRMMTSRPFSPIAAWVYKWVAKNRHLMPGASRTCKLEDNYRG